jgi:hypothetical protein
MELEPIIGFLQDALQNLNHVQQLKPYLNYLCSWLDRIWFEAAVSV